MFGIGPVEIAILALFCGGLAPFGIPPLPPDAAVLQAVPEKCLLCFASAGTGIPDESSTNHTDQLLATAEVQTFLSQCAVQFNGAFEQLGQSNQQAQPMIGIAKPLIETLLSRPMAVYVDRVEAGTGAPPSVVAGLIVNCGPRKADVASAVEAMEKMAIAQGVGADAIKDVTVGTLTLRHVTIGPMADVHWGFTGDYLLATVGPKAAAELVGRIGGTGSKPRWMTALEKQTGIKRISTIRYLDVSRVIATVVPMIPSNTVDVPAVLEAAGLADLTSIGGMSGFGTKGMVNRTIANFNGTPKGLFELLSGKPLTASDLKAIPGNSVFASAMRLDLTQVYTSVTDLVEKADPKAGQQLKQTATAGAQAFGFRLKEDVLDSFGDVWTIHSVASSSAPSGDFNQMSGIVATVTVRNKESLLKIQNLALGMIKAQSAQFPFSVTETKIGDIPAWQFVPTQSGAPSPAWAIAEGRLVVAGSLEALKTQLGEAAQGPGFAEQSAIASRLKTEPIMLSYLDTKTTLEQWMARAQAYGPIGAAMLAQQGVKVEMPQLPDFKAIGPHALPQTGTLRVAKQTIVFETYESVPLLGNAISAAPAVGASIGMLLSKVRSAPPATPTAISE